MLASSVSVLLFLFLLHGGFSNSCNSLLTAVFLPDPELARPGLLVLQPGDVVVAVALLQPAVVHDALAGVDLAALDLAVLQVGDVHRGLGGLGEEDAGPLARGDLVCVGCADGLK